VSVLESTVKITSVLLKGLDNVNLPVMAHVLDGETGELPVIANLNAHVDDKYYVKSITGLEPPDQNVAIARTASGGKYQGRISADREVVVLIGLNPDWDAGETPKLLRDNLYTLMSTGYDPKVRIMLVASIFSVAYVDAYITKFEAAIFDKNPVVQITLTCLNPTFSAESPIWYEPSELDLDYPNIYNVGTAEAGFQFAVKFTDDKNGWYIRQAENQNIGMEFDMQFHTNDVLSVSTIPGKRYVHWQKRRGKVTNKMGILTNSSEWLQLHPGMNNFVVPPQDKWVWKGNLVFTPQYWGI